MTCTVAFIFMPWLCVWWCSPDLLWKPFCLYLCQCGSFALAGDVNHIRVGSETNIQDNTLVHVAKTNVSGNVAPTIIGNKVTVGKGSTATFLHLYPSTYMHYVVVKSVFSHRYCRPLIPLMLNYCLARSGRSRNELEGVDLSSAHAFSGMDCRTQCCSTCVHFGGRVICRDGCHCFGWCRCREGCHGGSWVSGDAEDPHP